MPTLLPLELNLRTYYIELLKFDPLEAQQDLTNELLEWEFFL
jgi:hypothetical protein